MKAIKSFFGIVVGVILFALIGCAYITPTIVPPMTEELGYAVPNLYGVTVTGLVEGSYKLEVQKLKLWKYSVDATLQATEGIRSGLVELAALVGLGGTAALPMALKRLPSGAVKKEDYEEAGRMSPEDFEKRGDAE